jgi:hypothetical protein
MNREQKINLGKPPELLGLMTARGAPRYLMRNRMVISESDLSSANAEGYKPIMPRMQLAYLRKSIERPGYGSWLMVIGSAGEDARARIAALAVMQSAMLASLSGSDRPLWWPVYGGRWDKLRDDEPWRTSLGRVGLLVISNVAENSTPDKIEKVVDLLHMYSNIPRVLIVDGVDPLEFAASRLYRRPSRVVYVRRRARSQQV